MKRSTRRVAWIAAALLILVLGAGIALKTALSPEKLRGEIQRRIAGATGLPVEVDGAALSFVPFGVQLRGLRVGREAEPFVDLGSGLIRLELAPLLSRRVVVSRITLEEPRITLFRGPDGIVLPGNLGSSPAGRATPDAAAASPGEKGAAAFATTVERIEVRDGRLEIRTPDGADDITLDGIRLGARLEITEGGELLRTSGELHLSGLSLAALDAWRETLDRLQPVVAFDLESRHSEGRVVLRELRLQADPLDVAGTGVIEGLPEAPRIRFEVAPRTYELSELLPLVPAALIPEGRTPTARGPARIAATVEGPLGAEVPPAWTVEIGFDGAELAMEGFPVGIDGLRGNVRATATDLELDGVTAQLGGDPLAISGRIDGLDEGRPRVDLEIRGDVDLALLERGGFVPAGVSVGGRAKLDVHVMGRADAPEEARLTGTVQLAGGRVGTPDLPVPLTDLELDARLAGADIELNMVRARLGGSAFEGSGRIANALGQPDVQLTGRCPKLDLVELAPAPAAPDGDAAAAAAAATGDGAPPPAATPLVPPLPPFPAKVKLAIDSLITAGMVLTAVDLDADLRSTNGLVTAKIGRAETEAVSLERFDTRIDLAGSTASGTFQAPVVQAHVVPLTNVTGNFDLDADRQLRVADVKGSVWTGQVQGNAIVDLTDPKDPGFTIESKATGIEANDFLSAMTPARNLLFGTLNIESSFSGRGATAEDIVGALTGEGAVATVDGRLESTPAIRQSWAALGLDNREDIPFADLVAPFSLREGKVHTDNLAIAGRDADWTVRGFVGLDGQLDYSVTAELSEAVSDEMRRQGDLAKLLTGSSGRLVVDLHIHGDTRRPKVDLDRRKLAARVAENVKRQLQEELDRAKSDSAEKLGDALKGLFKKK